MQRRKFLSLVPAFAAATAITTTSSASLDEEGFIDHPVGNMLPVMENFVDTHKYVEVDVVNQMINLHSYEGYSGINANCIYSYIQDIFDEPKFLQYSVPMSAQTPWTYTFINGWKVNNVDAIRNASIAIINDELNMRFTSMMIVGRMPSECKVMWEIEDGPSGVSPWFGLPNEFLVPYFEGKKIRITAGNDRVDMDMNWGPMHVGLSVL